jgi:pimeloyl-ACP methyl ester carboxylesterase
MVHANGVRLCVETFGDPDAPAILLISGAGASMDWWEVEFCQRLASGGRRVIRYDHRDTGRSVGYPPGEPGYTGLDLIADAVGLIDALAGGRAHLVGVSMGGGIAQQLAIQHPDRVETLTLIATSPIGPRNPDDELPPMAPRLAARFANPPPEPDWTDRDAVVDHLVDDERAFAGPGCFDEQAVRALAHRVVDRSINPESSKNHWLIADAGGDVQPRHSHVTAPTLVIHGTEDPLFPPEHAAALAREITGAELLLLNGVGHQTPPPSTWDLVVPEILRHTAPRPQPVGVPAQR